MATEQLSQPHSARAGRSARDLPPNANRSQPIRCGVGRDIGRGFGALALWGLLATVAVGQLSLSPRFNLSENVRVDEVDNRTLAQFQRVDELIAADQFDEALETLDRVTAEHGRKLIEVEPGRYLSLHAYRHLRIAALPPAALDLYRRRVDPLAEAAYRRGVADRDRRLLARVVDEWFCSSSGDDAALALGELALERGEYNVARRHWLALFETPPTAMRAEAFEAARRHASLAKSDADLLDRFYVKQTVPQRDAPTVDDEAMRNVPEPTRPQVGWYVANADAWRAMSDAESAALVRIWKAQGTIGSRMAYPGTQIPPADIRARLILADLLSGNLTVAAEKLATFRTLHATATGKLAGQEGPLAERLATLATQARDWPPPGATAGCTTFAADVRRSGRNAGRVRGPIALSQPAWRVSLGKPLEANVESDRQILQRQPRIGESWNGLLSYFPVVGNGNIFVAYPAGIAALDAATGKPAWQAPSTDKLSASDALVFRDDGFAPLKTNQWSRGVPRFTATLQGERLIARVGPPATSSPTESRTTPAKSRSKIVVLDVSPQGQGRLALDPIETDDESLAFDGTPISDGRFLYATLRRSDVRPEVLIACYDLEENPPRQRWQTSVAAAETPGSGQLYECTHNVLTLDGDTLYLNTNLGAVAAIDVASGIVRWLHTYPRVKLGDLRRLADTGHFYRDLTPCLLHQDAVIVAPFDSPAIFALDAATGAVRWTTDAAPDAIHLLGVAAETLWVSGDRLYGIDVRSGRSVGLWPESVRADPRGIGRGVVVGDAVLWPTRDQLYVFESRGRGDKTAIAIRQPPVQWSRLGVFGGNLSWVDGYLIVATDAEVVAFAVDAIRTSAVGER